MLKNYAKGLKLTMLLLPLMISSGCAISGSPLGLTNQTREDEALLSELGCAGWKPIPIQPSWPEGSEGDVVVHNEFGVAKGCWEEPQP